MSRRALPLVVLSVFAGCTAPEPADRLHVELREFSIEATSLLPGGPVSLEVENAGEFVHTLVVSQADGSVIAATGIIQPGDATTLEVDLSPGTYEFTCRVVVRTEGGRVIDHYQEGMEAHVRVDIDV